MRPQSYWDITCEFEDGSQSKFHNQEWAEVMAIIDLAQKVGVNVDKITLVRA